MLLGTPCKETWPDLDCLKEWHEFPVWTSSGINKVFPTLENNGLELLRSMLTYDSSIRITAKAATSHPFFNNVNRNII